MKRLQCRVACVSVSAMLTIGLCGQALAQDFQGLVTIHVAGDDRYTLPHTIRLEPATHGVSRSVAELETRLWRATRTSERGTEAITSDTCPGLQNAALSFLHLPPIPIAPFAGAVFGDATIPIPPTRKDGFSTRLSFSTKSEDGSTAEVQIAHGNAYAAWGHDTVSGLLSCWGPLLP
ncbi:hypothetical protein [Brevundimonas sp.]|jgi:hypothetical protein|uniref:hypothetical protein n=1 Tax=Brevundimonas sp. TaxID=1871086 RepID=UPI00378399B5